MANEKKKANVFVRIGRAIAKFFKDVVSEVKKVVWPSKKQVLNNTAVVLAMCIICGIVLFAADALFSVIPELLIKLAAH